MNRIFAALTSLTLAALASGQCADWRAGPFHGLGGVDFDARALTTYDPDGAGPLTPQLVLGGYYAAAGGVTTNGIARWDGNTWQGFAGGATYNNGNHGAVYAMAVYPAGTPLAGQLVAAGSFDLMGGVPASNVARWDGSAWHALGTGLDGGGIAVTFWDPDGPGPTPPQLIVGGAFATAGGVAANDIARFDGISWSALGSGIARNDPNSPTLSIHALTSWDPDGTGPQTPLLVAGGYFDSAGGVPAKGIAAWNGTQWQALSTGVDGDAVSLNSLPGLEALTTWDPDGAGPLNPVLVAGGYFDTAGGVTTNGIARWDGTSWSGFSTGMNDEVESLSVFNGQLVAGGDFTIAGGNAVIGVAKWNGAAWQPFGDGLNSDVLALVPFTPPGGSNAQLAAAGSFYASDSSYVPEVAFFNGNSWLPFTTPAFGVSIYAAAQLGARAIVGGDFWNNTSGAAASLHDVAAWDGLHVSALGIGMNLPVHALKTFNTGIGITQFNHLVAGGEFTNAGGALAAHIAQWDENAVVGFPIPAWTALGPGVNNTVRAIERFNNATVAGGDFTATGNNIATLNHIAQWNGTTWSQLGTGLNGQVNAIKLYNGSLYVGGLFTTANGTLNTGGLARWNGTAWSQVGGTFGGQVVALEVYDGDLIIAGTFGGIPGTASPNIARYNSVTNAYTNLGSGGADGGVFALAVDNGLLFAGGSFAHAGGTAAQNIARWNGSNWSAVSGGAGSTVYALSAFHNEVELGGVFNTVRNGAIDSSGWARFSTDGVPFIVQQPFNQGAACAGASASFSCRAAQGYSLNFQWRHNGVPITMGVAPNGTVFATDGAVLDIANAHSSETGSYDCVISNACGSVTTIAATFFINSADFNGDGNIGTDADIEAFFACLAGNCCPTCGTADFNADGNVGTDADIESFFRVLGGGRC